MNEEIKVRTGKQLERENYLLCNKSKAQIINILIDTEERIDKTIEYIEKIQNDWNNNTVKPDVNLYLFESLIKGVTKLIEIKEILKD